jgi:hypothetical protein
MSLIDAVGYFERWTTQDLKDSVSADDTSDMFTLAYQWQDKKHRHVWDLCDHIDKLDEQLTAKDRELAAARAEVERLKIIYDQLAYAVGWTKERHSQDGDSPVDVARDLIDKNANLKSELELLTKQRADWKALATADASHQRENVRLKSELGKCKLKWQTGPVPKDGVYRLRSEHSTQVGWLHIALEGETPKDPMLRMLEWSGPIPEPEAEGV